MTAGNNMQAVFRALIDLGEPMTLADIRATLPYLHPRSVEDALRALARGGYVTIRYTIAKGATCPQDGRGRKGRGVDAASDE
jgi:hypothetical protein